MKALVFILSFAGLCAVCPVYGQLNSDHNYYRAGDVLVKQQVEYVGTGEAGIGQLWDFGSFGFGTYGSPYILDSPGDQRATMDIQVFLKGEQKQRKINKLIKIGQIMDLVTCTCRLSLVGL